MFRTSEQFEQALGELRSRVANPRVGFFGPKTVAWRVSKESAILTGGGRALFLQLAHPSVAAGVRHHSAFDSDPFGRSKRTFDSVYQIMFGDADTALAMARRIHTRHLSVRGLVDEDSKSRSYEANEPPLLLWVLATLIDTARAVYERVVTPLSVGERHQYYSEYREASVLYGIPRSDMPESYPEFQFYFRNMLDGHSLCVRDDAREITSAFRSGPPSAFVTGVRGKGPMRLLAPMDRDPMRTWVVRWSDRLVAEGLPSRLRAEYGLTFTETDALQVTGFYRRLSRTLPKLPDRFRYCPYFLDAQKRLDP